MARRSLRDALGSADAARFVGREAERRVIDELFSPATQRRILYVHGPGGIGKSALVRAAARSAAEQGYRVEALGTRGDFRQVDERVDELVTTLEGPCCIIVDEVDLLGSELGAIRDRLLDGLAEDARLVLAGRLPPDASWRLDGIDAAFVDLAVAPLTDDDALLLLQANGVDPRRANDLVAWAHGSPLALTVAALSPDGPVGAPESATLESRLTTWIAGSSRLDVDDEVLEVAALAPVVDARIIAAALPSRPTRDAMARLAALPVVESLGNRAVLHPVLARAVEARLAEQAPERHRILRRRIVEHLGARARLGDIAALIEMSQFVTDPKLRQAISNRPSRTLFTDVPAPGEFTSFAARQGFADESDWPELSAWAETAAAYSLVARQTDRTPVMFGLFARADRVPELGPITASLRASVERSEVDPVRSFVGMVCFADVSEQLRADAARLGSGALMHLHRVPDMQAILLHFPSPDRRPIEALSALAAPLHAGLARSVAISDFRPEGAVGFVESVVLGELGFPSRPADLAALLTIDDDPARYAALTTRLDRIFDDSPTDRRLRAVAELAHLGPRRRVEEHLEALHVSRRTWFRLLREARERILDTDR